MCVCVCSTHAGVGGEAECSYCWHSGGSVQEGGAGNPEEQPLHCPRYVGVCAWSDEGEHPSTGQQAWVSVWYCVMSEIVSYDVL